MLTDAITLSRREMTPEGYLKAMATITCVGVQDYLGSELQGLVDNQLNPNTTYRVFRPPSTVFDDVTVQSAKLKPLTDGHPTSDVNCDNHRSLSIGNLGENVLHLNDNSLCINTIVTDSDGVKKIQAGTHQLSSGYTCKLVEEQGVFDGRPYDLRFDGGMNINHVALVDQGRCGNGARILDKRGNKMTDKSSFADLDMDNLLEQVASKIMPDIQKMIQSDDFVEKLAAIVGNNLSASSQPTPDEKTVPDDMNGDPDTDVDNDMVTEDGDMEHDKQHDDVKDDDDDLVADKSINDRINARVAIIDKARRLADDIIIDNKDNVEILRDSLRSYHGDSVDGKSIDYLSALADVIIEKRKKADVFYDNVKSDVSSFEIPKNSIDLRRILNRAH